MNNFEETTKGIKLSYGSSPESALYIGLSIKSWDPLFTLDDAILGFDREGVSAVSGLDTVILEDLDGPFLLRGGGREDQSGCQDDLKEAWCL